MATISELVYDVREALKLYSDDVEISNRYIIYLYNIKRGKYLRRELNRLQRNTDNSALQTFCIKLEEVSASECDVNFECEKILRSTTPIPTPIDLNHTPALTKVKPTTVISKPFNFISKDRIPYVAGSPTTGVYAFLDPSGYIYVYSKSDLRLLDCLTVTGVFQDPLELKNFPACCNCSVEENPCYDDATTEYPLQSHFIDIIRNEIVQELALRTQIKEDTVNDATETS